MVLRHEGAWLRANLGCNATATATASCRHDGLTPGDLTRDVHDAKTARHKSNCYRLARMA